MTSKQRVLSAFARQAPDRVPINYASNPGIDGRLKQHFGLASDDREGLLRALEVDFRGVGPRFVGVKRHADDPQRGVKADMWGNRRRWVEHESGGYWDFCDFPLREAGVDEINAWPMPVPDEFDYSALADECRRHSDYAVFYGGGGFGDVINGNGFVRGTEQTLVDVATLDPAGMRLAERRVTIQLEIGRRTLEAAAGGIDFVWMGEDLGTQRGPLLSLDMYRNAIKPFHQRIIDLAKQFDLPVMIHSCGSSSWVFDELADMGVDVVDTLQPEARDMAPAYLKECFGDRLAFHGCISTAGPVATGTVAETEQYCRDILETMMPGGGYCFAPTHQLQDNSPTENVVAMYAVAREDGRYA
jgi:uroporphyrinogen decarboxylase